MELTEQKLLANNGELALKLAKSADKEFANSEFAQYWQIINQKVCLVAYYLDLYSDKTGWSIQHWEFNRGREVLEACVRVGKKHYNYLYGTKEQPQDEVMLNQGHQLGLF